MAMLRVSSYRRLFEDGIWGRKGGMNLQSAGLYRAKRSAAAADDCDCDKLDFGAAKALNLEGLTRFVQERSDLASLNNRLVSLIELARCFEQDNKFLECQIVELEEKFKPGPASSSRVLYAGPPAQPSLDAVVERLRQEKDEILCDSEELQKELLRLQDQYEKVAQQRIFYQQQRQDISQEVDTVTAECLALREQANIYEEQLANMEEQHRTEVEDLLEPSEETIAAAAARAGAGFKGPDVTPALLLKEFYCALSENLQSECAEGFSVPAAILTGEGGKLQQAGKMTASPVKELTKPENIDELKRLIADLQQEQSELENCNAELEDEVEMKRARFQEEISELKMTLSEMQQQEVDLRAQIKEQCEDYQQLLSEKMARDLEILAYRSLVMEEETRLCSL